MNSFLLIDKPAGWSSFDVIRQLRRILGIKKIGHAGTLDPFATGLLICATGQYTRLLKYAEAQSKTYTASLLLGKKSSTGDPEGEIIASSEISYNSQDLSTLPEKILALKSLRVPEYSAVKINGKRAYKLAREGKILEMPIRPVTIHDFRISQSQDSAVLDYTVKVSKGTYIRALSEYIAEALGCVGMTIALRREAIGDIGVDSAVNFDDLETKWRSGICPAKKILKLDSILLNNEQTTKIIHGRGISVGDNFAESIELAMYDEQDRLLGIGCVETGMIRPKQVFDPGESL
nr:tRNA pseudouridine55 synthase [Candidatus Cloacimonadota bacterium]